MLMIGRQIQVNRDQHLGSVAGRSEECLVTVKAIVGWIRVKPLRTQCNVRVRNAASSDVGWTDRESNYTWMMGACLRDRCGAHT